jgi:molybdopterin-guanine dinucleotide biosynthesis protein MobB
MVERSWIRRSGEETAVKKPYTIAIVGNSGAGKTTLLERLIPALKRNGVRVGVVKHDAHRFDIDHPGKDSHRLTAAGADTMMITSASMLAMVKRHAASPPIEELIGRYFSDMDLVLVEGFRGSSLPKIEVHRKEFRRALICRGERNDPGLAAVASDEPLDLDVPVLDLNDPGAIAEFIASLLSRIEEKP